MEFATPAPGVLLTTMIRSPHLAHRSCAAGAERGYTAIELLIVVAIMSVIAAMAIPFTSNTLELFRVGGDARSIVNGVSLAKMRAASDFTDARLYVDLAARSYRVEKWQKTAPQQWVLDGSASSLSQNDNFGFGQAGAAPPNAVSPISEAPQCKDNSGNDLANTACIVFNSRGLPVDNTGAPTSGDLYLTDGITTFGITTSGSGQTRLWKAGAGSAPNWVQQ